MPQNSRRIIAAALVVLIAAASFYAGRQQAPTIEVKFENERVKVSASHTPPGGRRESYVRPTDQLIVFLDDAQYEAVADGTSRQQQRRAGEVIWHAKGEVAPTLLNKGAAYRNLIIVLK